MLPRPGPRAAIVGTIGLLAAYHQIRRHLIPGEFHVVSNTAMIGVMAATAWAAGLTRRELGLARDTWWSGVRLGGAVVVLVGTTVGAAGLLGLDPLGLISDAADVSSSEMLWDVLFRIPIATVVFEELAFRGVLGPLFERVVSSRAALVWSSAVFGLWHISVPTDASPFDLPGQLGTVVVTALAGAGFMVLRRRSGSLAAPMLAHWATNGVSYAAAWLAVHR